MNLIGNQKGLSFTGHQGKNFDEHYMTALSRLRQSIEKNYRTSKTNET